MSVVTFDFDNTLKMTAMTPDGFEVDLGPNLVMLQNLRAYLANGQQVHIVTTRTLGHGEVLGATEVDLFCSDHDLTVSGIHFTNGKDKTPTLLALGTVRHFDDDPDEIDALPDGVGVLVPVDPSWHVPFEGAANGR